MKDGRTHLAYKAEHVVDLETDLVVAAEIRTADSGDTQTLVDSVLAGQANLQAAGSETEIEEVAADKGYHGAETLELCEALGLRTYIPEKQRKYESRWTDKPEAYRRSVYNNRRRVKRAKSKALQRLRSERCERTFAHVCDTGGARRSWLRGLVNVTKRYLISVAAHNLGRILRKLFGVGKPKALQGQSGLAALAQFVLLRVVAFLWRLSASGPPTDTQIRFTARFPHQLQTGH
jgi:transposase